MGDYWTVGGMEGGKMGEGSRERGGRKRGWDIGIHGLDIQFDGRCT